MSPMKFLLRLIIVLAMVIGGWFWWQGRVGLKEEQALARMPVFVQDMVQSILTVEESIRHRVQMVQSGATMMKEGKAMIEEGVRGGR